MLDLDAIFDPDRPINTRPKVERKNRTLSDPTGDVINNELPQEHSLLPSPSSSPEPTPSLREWNAEARELIAFFRSARSRLPQAPFRLTRWLFISEPAKWYRSLDVDINAGPTGFRARMGALQEDLRRLKEALSKDGLDPGGGP
jgi:hypothetical protein